MSGFKMVTLKVRKNVPTEWSTEGEKTFPIKFKTEWEDYGLNLFEISYWRGYTGKDTDGRSGIFTQVYLAGNPKPMVLAMKREDFEKQITEQLADDREAQNMFSTKLAEAFTEWLNLRESQDKDINSKLLDETKGN